jgi:hypothetical protein
MFLLLYTIYGFFLDKYTIYCKNTCNLADLTRWNSDLDLYLYTNYRPLPGLVRESKDVPYIKNRSH